MPGVLTGTDNPNCKLSNKEVRLIRQIRKAAPNISTRALAKMFDCSQSNIVRILNYTTRKTDDDRTRNDSPPVRQRRQHQVSRNV